ncbi:MAG: response regulator, partial [Methanomassiliicoccales archaeon]
MSIPSDAIVHVLIVDDELQIRELSKEFLEEVGGIEVETAASAREARGAHGRIGFDAIVSDYQMPEEDGIQFLKSLRTNGDLTPFILFTGKGREDVVIEALNNGADSYLQKGGNPRSLYAELEQRIRVAVGKRRAERDVDQRNRELQRANHELGTADVELRAQLDEIETSNEELRAKDETLRSSEARFTNLFENMSSGVAIHAIILDPAGIPYDYRFLNANHAFEKMTGMERSVILGRTVREVLHQIEPIWIERYGRVALTGVADHFESHSAALERDFSVSVYRNDPGQFTTLILDITERVRQEKKQRDLSIKYQTLLRTLPIGVTISDDKGNIIESNEEATRLLGLSI